MNVKTKKDSSNRDHSNVYLLELTCVFYCVQIQFLRHESFKVYFELGPVFSATHVEEYLGALLTFAVDVYDLGSSMQQNTTDKASLHCNS